MPDILTSAKGLTKQTAGGNSDTWGGILNASLDLVDAALGQQTALAITTSMTLSAAQAQKIGYKFTGTPGAARTITFPVFYGPLYVRNAVTDGFTLTCGMASGATVAVPAGTGALIYSDGTDFVQVGVGRPVILPATTTAYAHLRFTTGGAAPTAPGNGDFWYDGTNLKLMVGTATKTVTIT